MAGLTILNRIEIAVDQSFDFTPEFEFPGDPFAFTVELIPNPRFIVSSLNDETGQAIGQYSIDDFGPDYLVYVIYPEGEESFQLKAYLEGFEDPVIKYCKNPILLMVEAGESDSTIEIEVFAEKTYQTDEFTSLGVFRFRTNQDGNLVEQVESLLAAWLSEKIRFSLPFIGIGSGPVRDVHQIARWYCTWRVAVDGVFGPRKTTNVNIVVYGGHPEEQFFNGFNLEAYDIIPQSSGQRQMVPVYAPAFIYFLCKGTEASITWNYFSKGGEPAAPIEQSAYLVEPWTILRLPVALPNPEQSSNFTCTVTVGISSTTMNLFVGGINSVRNYEFTFINGKGGWSYLCCTASASRILDVNQSVSEAVIDPASALETRVPQYNVFGISGRKRVKVATGYMAAIDLEVLMQDFVLSPLKYIWNQPLEKWIPVILITKSIEYKDDDRFLRSAVFEFQYAFDNNIPSLI